jgi:serine protease Do
MTRRNRDASKAWLPVTTQVVTKELAASLGDPGIRGMRITRVYPGCNAERAGLLVGDVVTSINGEALTPRSAEDGELLNETVRQYSIGSKAEHDCKGQEKLQRSGPGTSPQSERHEEIHG